MSHEIIMCNSCSRLRRHCKKIAEEKRKSFTAWEYWGRPVPNFGDPSAKLLIVGLAPAAHGANRTGRMFTGDRSGDWLYRALFRAGFANQPYSAYTNDGLELHNVLITAVAHCAPPDNKPTPNEIKNCRRWLGQTFDQTPFNVIVALGKIAWDQTLTLLYERELLTPQKTSFSHGAFLDLKNNRRLIASYHPSQQNTFTGRLTEPMFDSIFEKARESLTRLGPKPRFNPK